MGFYITLQKAWEENLVCFTSHIKSRKLPQDRFGMFFPLYNGLSVNLEGWTLCQKHEAERNLQGKHKVPPHYCPQLWCARHTQKGFRWRFGCNRPYVETKILHFLSSFQVTPTLPVPGPTLGSWDSTLPGQNPVLLCHYWAVPPWAHQVASQCFCFLFLKPDKTQRPLATSGSGRECGWITLGVSIMKKV